MIQLPLEKINSKAPYQVTTSAYGDFRFLTSLGINYVISFEEDHPFGGCDTYQFVIQKIEQQKSPHDPLVEQTILAIIDVFFSSYLNVLLYICDDSDGREEKRNRLFLTWFEKHADPGRFTICTAHAKVEEKGFYAAIIVENRNPKLHAITDDFQTTAKALTAGKPE